VAVLAPVNSEKPTVIATCAAAGIHVYTDKPMATTLEGNARIAQAIRQAKTLLLMSAAGGYGATVGWKRLIELGALGDLVQFVNIAPHRLQLRPDAGWTRPLWSYERQQNGGVIVDLAVHGINMWRYLSGREVVEVTAVHSNRRFPQYPQLEDSASVLLRMDDNSTAFLAPSWLTPDAEPSHGRSATYIIGTTGQLEITSPGLVHGLERAQERQEVVLTTASQSPHRPDMALDHRSSAEDDFLAAVENGSQPAISAEFLLESQRIALLARDAADQQRTIRCRQDTINQDGPPPHGMEREP
jgi:myo-inositol 2-dehydrogenase/D-chiro-inositol 1-dehydrogenase